MTYSLTDSGYLIRIFKGEKIVATITDFCRNLSIGNAQVVGIGGVQNATLGFYDLGTRMYEFDTYEETMEILSIIGNVSILEDRPFLHAHVSLGKRDKSVIGGHLKEATVGGTCEIVMSVNDSPLQRTLDEETGLSLWQLAENYKTTIL